MRRKSLFILLFFIFLASFSISCVRSKDAEAENLRKELETLKKEKEDEKNGKQKEAGGNSSQNAETEKTKEATNKPSPTPKPKVSAPVGATVAYCNAANVVVRDSPSLNAKKVNALKKGEKVFVIEESDNYDEWQGNEANWAYIQKEDGQRGWVFTPFISYQ